MVPDDISVVGFDDVLDFDQNVHQLTTVRIDISEMAHLSLQRILNNITKKDTTHKTYVVNSTIVHRDSVKSI
jgi:DNA-binding LacI/PurR family transcriptional regulator